MSDQSERPTDADEERDGSEYRADVTPDPENDLWSPFPDPEGERLSEGATDDWPPQRD